MTSVDIHEAQNDYAHFLPALSGFYATYVGKQRYPDPVDGPYVPDNRKNGVESLNWLNRKDGQFQYHWSLYSAGHAELDINKDAPKEDMVRKRDRTTLGHLVTQVVSKLVRVFGKVTGKILTVLRQ